MFFGKKEPEKEKPRVHVYTEEEFEEIYEANDIEPHEHSWLASVHIDPVIVNIDAGADLPGFVMVTNLPTTSTLIYDIDEGPTGYYLIPGAGRAIFLNENDSVIDYDLWSELSPTPDARAYMWLLEPFDSEHLQYLQVWYRDDVYPDYGPPFEGKLDWYDLPRKGSYTNDD